MARYFAVEFFDRQGRLEHNGVMTIDEIYDHALRDGAHRVFALGKECEADVAEAMTLEERGLAGTQPKRHEITILWGGQLEVGDRAKTYSFACEGELKAFMHGVEEMHGWTAWRETEPGYVVTEDDLAI